jgi:hypothetical protein
MVLLVGAGGCAAAPTEPNPLNQTATARADAETVAAAQTALASLPTAPAAESSTACAWMWATVPQIALTAQVNDALLAAGLRGIEASASSYGETCANAEGSRFVAMDTSFDFFIPVEAGRTDEALGDIAAQLIAIVRGFPREQRPGINPGYIRFIIVSPQDDRILRVRENDALAALEAHSGGAALLAALEAAQEG